MSEDVYPSTHPPLPPTTEDDRILWLRLLRSRRVGPTTFHRLVAEHGGVSAAFESLPKVAADAGLDHYSPCSESAARAELKAADAHGAQMICIGTPGYPDQLANLSDAPPIIWLRGRAEVILKPLISVIGARNASSLGLRMARALSNALAKKGYVVVSGLARGIDTAAHQAALQTGTVAVMGGGVDVPYPAENAQFAKSILNHGAVVSEQPMGMVPRARHFPTRNRIISGLSRGVVVVEAAAKSGSLGTARIALEQGREVMAVPGHPLDPRAAGCNMLLRDGAVLVRNAKDIEEMLPDTTEAEPPVQNTFDLGSVSGDTDRTPAQSSRALRETIALHRQILDRLGPSPVAEDQLIRDLAVSAQEVSPVLTDLEMDGRITRQAGGLISIGANGTSDNQAEEPIHHDRKLA
ncbi:MAG: DNA-processing protein DprA [Pseudomonadota bacterium]